MERMKTAETLVYGAGGLFAIEQAPEIAGTVIDASQKLTGSQLNLTMPAGGAEFAGTAIKGAQVAGAILGTAFLVGYGINKMFDGVRQNKH